MIEGFRSFLWGYKLLWRSRRLKIYALVPFLVSTLFFVASLTLGWGFVVHFVSMWLPSSIGFWMGILHSLLSVILFFVFAIILGILSLLMANLVLAPFNSLLAEQVLQDMGILSKRNEGYWGALRAATRMFWVSLKKSIVFLVLGISLFVLSIIPGLALVCWLLGCLLLSFDITDYSFEALRMEFSERILFFRIHFKKYLGFALAMGLTFFVPGANLLLLPGAVIGGAILVARIKGARREV